MVALSDMLILLLMRLEKVNVSTLRMYGDNIAALSDMLILLFMRLEKVKVSTLRIYGDNIAALSDMLILLLMRLDNDVLSKTNALVNKKVSAVLFVRINRYDVSVNLIVVA